MFKECISIQNTRKLLDLLGVKGDDEYLLLFDCLVESLTVDNKKKKQDCTVLWENGCNSIHIVSGDIFDYCFKRNKGNNIIVIPVDTNFNIHVSTKLEMINPLVSAETLHGKWIRRCENAGYKENEIQNKIQTFLNTQYHNEYKIGEYPIGTIVPFGTKFGTTYLLSISIFDDSNIAHSNEESIKIAIKSLLEFYDCNGQGYPVYIPLMGTGRSRVNLSYQQSFELIKETLLQNRTHIQGIVNIVALPEVYKKLEKGVK